MVSKRGYAADLMGSGMIWPGDYQQRYFKRLKIMPNGDVKIDPFTLDEGRALGTNQSYVAVYGQAIYYDTFGTQHFTKFCTSLLASGAKTGSVKCAANTYTDNN
jgi:hypothetical protein